MMLRTAILLFLVISALNASALWAQKWEVSPFFGYRWGGELSDGTYGDPDAFDETLQFESGPNYGLIVGYFVQPKIQVRAFWDRQNTSLDVIFEQLDKEEKLGDATIDYLHLGVLMLFLEPDIRLQPFFVVSLGGTYISPAGSNIDSSWFTSAGYAVGVRYFFTDNVGGFIQNRGTSSVITDSEQRFCNEETDKCYTLPKDTWMFQIDISAGVIIAF
jgi:hypothetical protein